MSNTTTAKLQGHSAHTKDAGRDGLSGRIDRPIHIVVLGAGSNFTPRLLNDVLRIKGTHGGTLSLVDIDETRLGTMKGVIELLIKRLDQSGWAVRASVDLRSVLTGAHYVVNCIEVSGSACVAFENDIPLKYGIDQCIGDTIGPGGLFKALRTVPVWLKVLRDCEELCPQALILNYTNPMGMMCLAAGRSSSMKVVGLCHSVQGTSQLLAEYAGVPITELEWECAGINHLAWFTKLCHQGQNLYPRLQDKFTRDIAAGIAEFDAGHTLSDATENSHGVNATVRYSQTDLIRKDMCLHFGAFTTESSGHLSEYLPYYRKSEAGRKLLRLAYDGGSRFYATNWPRWRQEADMERNNMLRGKQALDWDRSWEYASWIIEAREKDVPFRIHGNVMNNCGQGGQLITNLPADGCVEVACMVDRNGVHPTRYGSLPAQMAAISSSNMSMIDLATRATLEQSKEAAIHALLLDPLSAAVCTPAQIKAMVLELFAAEHDFFAAYR